MVTLGLNDLLAGSCVEHKLVGAHPAGRTAATTDVTNVTTGTMTFNFPAEGSYPDTVNFDLTEEQEKYLASWEMGT